MSWSTSITELPAQPMILANERMRREPNGDVCISGPMRMRFM